MVYRVIRSNNWIEHHGIQGQKWGVTNGPPYPLDYGDHNSIEKASNSANVIDNYEKHNPKNGRSSNNTSASKRSVKTGASGSSVNKENSGHSSIYNKRKANLMAKGMSEAEAEATIKFQNKALAITAIAAAAIGGAAVYGAVHANMNNKDFVLNAGKEMYRVASSGSDTLHNTFYAATNKFDARKYAGGLALDKKKSEALKDLGVFQKTLRANSDIKVAGAETGEIIFKKLRKEGAFGSAFALNDIRSYSQFNEVVLLNDKEGKMARTFYDALKAEGYGGVIDSNDAFIGGYSSMRPVIFFDQGSNVSVTSVHELSMKEIKSNARFMKLATNAQAFLTDPSKMAVKVGGTAIGSYVTIGRKYNKELAALAEIDDTKKKKS